MVISFESIRYPIMTSLTRPYPGISLEQGARLIRDSGAHPSNIEAAHPGILQEIRMLLAT